VLTIISASLSAIMFSASMSGTFVGGGDEHPEVVSRPSITAVAH